MTIRELRENIRDLTDEIGEVEAAGDPEHRLDDLRAMVLDNECAIDRLRRDAERSDALDRYARRVYDAVGPVEYDDY